MLLCLVCLFTLLSGQCLAYTVSGKVYQKGTTITVPNAFVNLNSSSGSSNQGTTDAFGSFSLGWAGANMIGNTMTLSASGWTYDETFILYDIETESLWYPLPGKSGLNCISGHHADKSLAELPSSQMRWANWVLENPETGT